jgi:hypothetical protein
MAYPQNSWAILPATQALLNKTKCTLEEAMLVYGGGEILFVVRENPDGKPTLMFLSSAGTMGIPAGTEHKAHHDQNLRPYGYLKVRGSIEYKVVDGKVQCESLPELYHGNGMLSLDSKAPLFCFK